jgi:hypothetical protein
MNHTLEELYLHWFDFVIRQMADIWTSVARPQRRNREQYVLSSGEHGSRRYKIEREEKSYGCTDATFEVGGNP